MRRLDRGVFHPLELAEPHRQQAVEASDGAGRQAQPGADFAGKTVTIIAALQATQPGPLPNNVAVNSGTQVTKPPTAELRPNQTDQDSLPPYDVLDAILLGLVEREEPAAAIADRGFPVALVKRVQHMLYIAEYKRRQAPPGVKISRRNLSRDRRYPITNAFRDK